MSAPAPARDPLAERVEQARRATVEWLATMQAPGQPEGVRRISAAHDPEAWPGALLPGTYNAALCAALIGAPAPDPAPLVVWLEAHRLPDGRFRAPGMTDATVFKKPDLVETWGYIDFHLTNYALGAVKTLAPMRPANLAFARAFLDPVALGDWLSRRDLRDPWQEGNNLVNLGGFLRGLRAQGAAGADRALALWFDWHERLQEPSTGFWGVGQHGDPQRLLHAFAGSMHDFHLYYAEGRPIPFHDRAIDYALTLPPRIDSACIDVDAVDLLVHGLMVRGWRRAETLEWLRAMLPELLDWQNPDGGFCDVREGVRRQDGWVGGYAEPQGLSNTFATFFRWIAIAMIADVFWPGRWPWTFRRDVGIGYRRPAR